MMIENVFYEYHELSIKEQTEVINKLINIAKENIRAIDKSYINQGKSFRYLKISDICETVEMRISSGIAVRASLETLVSRKHMDMLILHEFQSLGRTVRKMYPWIKWFNYIWSPDEDGAQMYRMIEILFVSLGSLGVIFVLHGFGFLIRLVYTLFN